MSSSADDEATRVFDPLFARARHRVGEVLCEKWHIDVLLGVGGMAAVYAATHRNGSRVALKILHTELSVNAQVRQRFLREGYIANTVANDGAVKIVDDDTAEDGSAFLVMELLDGETLEARRERMGGALSEDEVLSVADQVLDVLAAAHAKGIVHRDLKPENVFLTREGRAKVLDFGIARLRELSSASTATRGGASMGTPAFMAPEQARGRWEEVDARSDIWALGATMFELLSGRLVHEQETANETLLAAMTNHAPLLGSVAPTIAPSVGYIVDKALRFERERRWPDATVMQEAIRHAFHDRHGAPLSTAPKLIVPPEVPNRTLAGAEGAAGPRLPTTARPIANSQPPGTTPAGRLRSRAVIGVVAAIGVTIVGVTLLAATRGRRHSDAVSASSSGPDTTPSFAPVATVAPAPMPSPPEISATDLPSVTASAVVTRVPQPAAVRATPPLGPVPAPPPQPTATAVKTECVPPYTIDATGHRHWKVQCL